MRYQKGSWSQFALECQWKTNREPAQEGRMSITITQIHNYTIAVLQKKSANTQLHKIKCKSLMHSSVTETVSVAIFLTNFFKIKKGKLVFYGSHGLHLLANALCAGCHECALGVVPQVHLAVPMPMHLVHLVQDLLDGGRLSCPLDVHCIRKPVCDCRNLDVAVALSARLCSRYDAALRVRLHHDHYTSTTGSCTTCGPSCSKTKQGRALHPSCSSKTARRQGRQGLIYGWGRHCC